jgi:hypothetical protein
MTPQLDSNLERTNCCGVEARRKYYVGGPSQGHYYQCRKCWGLFGGEEGPAKRSLISGAANSDPGEAMEPSTVQM